ncbi:MAG TPA: glycosyltransferase family 2 protein [Vicinamibacteria bacterium]|nr:glycosyltransferase family 2 protein [Vicinamibacteria bacterium]HRB12986.1 glycosyltransferase family 2 protein [Vicinamibacteria bacterium]
MSASRVTIVVVTYNSADVLGDCLASIELHAPDARAIVVDNASTDGSAGVALAAGSFVTLIRSEENEGFSKANNRALRTIGTEFALILNPDARLTSSTIPELLAAADRLPAAAALGPKTVHEDGRPQVSFGPDLSLAAEYRQRKLVKGVKSGEARALEDLRAASAEEREVDWISGSCMLLRMSAARDAGFFDERYFLYEEDADLCLRLRRAGGKVVFIPQAVVIHELGTSMAKASKRARDAYDASHRLYYRLHRTSLERVILTAVITITNVLRLDFRRADS